jgi:hypothetical protein
MDACACFYLRRDIQESREAAVWNISRPHICFLARVFPLSGHLSPFFTHSLLVHSAGISLPFSLTPCPLYVCVTDCMWLPLSEQSLEGKHYHCSCKHQDVPRFRTSFPHSYLSTETVNQRAAQTSTGYTISSASHYPPFWWAIKLVGVTSAVYILVFVLGKVSTAKKELEFHFIIFMGKGSKRNYWSSLTKFDGPFFFLLNLFVGTGIAYS